MKKVCTQCQLEKDLTEFHKKANGKFGRHSECKMCLRARMQVTKDNWDELKKKHARSLENARRAEVRTILKDAESMCICPNCNFGFKKNG